MSKMVKLCSVDDVEADLPFPVEVDGYPPLAVYLIDGAFHVTSNTCTHGNAMLTDGFQEGDTIECPFHGGSFCIKTGAAKNLPCEEPLSVYKVQVDEGQIFITE
ncbi:MAG: non-heme iron oxygenase ferredoxin subunit [Kordiimonadaceae bacterium]|nr:non-heme iron oxygenase ferredoxin subunit [Kordiimonadaceae bacterium]